MKIFERIKMAGGVYRYTGTLVLPERSSSIGVSAPRIAAFPQTGVNFRAVITQLNSIPL